MAKAHFQTEVQKLPAIGLPGDKASLNPFVYTERNYLAGDEAITIGKFVWSDPDNPDSSEAGSVLKALSEGNDGVRPLGIVERNLSYANYDLLDGGTLIVPQFALLNIVRRGDLYAVAMTDAQVGHKVYATFSDGSLQTYSTGQDIYGAIETAWEVVQGGYEGELIIISNWNTDVVINNNGPQQ
jgi:hypothetical protein